MVNNHLVLVSVVMVTNTSGNKYVYGMYLSVALFCSLGGGGGVLQMR